MTSTGRRLFTLTPLCLVCGLAIAVVHTWLNPRIAAAQRQATQAIYLNALHIQPNTDVQLDAVPVGSKAALLGLRTAKAIYIARRHDRVVGVVLPLTARNGYVDDIDLLLGVDPDGKIISVQVVSEHETRGLGDKIERGRSAYQNGDWLDQFNGVIYDPAQKNRWHVRNDGGDFDAITGATVTSRAVVSAVRRGLEYFTAHRDELSRKKTDD